MKKNLKSRIVLLAMCAFSSSMVWGASLFANEAGCYMANESEVTWFKKKDKEPETTSPAAPTEKPVPKQAPAQPPKQLTPTTTPQAPQQAPQQTPQAPQSPQQNSEQNKDKPNKEEKKQSTDSSDLSFVEFLEAFAYTPDLNDMFQEVFYNEASQADHQRYNNNRNQGGHNSHGGQGLSNSLGQYLPSVTEHIRSTAEKSGTIRLDNGAHIVQYDNELWLVMGNMYAKLDILIYADKAAQQKNHSNQNMYK